MKASRPPVWLEGLGDWSWPGRGGATAEALPPPWVPAFPPRSDHMAAPAAPASWQPGRARMLGMGTLLSGLAAVSVAVATHGQLGLERLVGVSATRPLAQSRPATRSATPPVLPLPTLNLVSQDADGSSIDAASYTSAALRGGGSFLVYLPAGYASTNRHYPVLYLLHGDDQLDTAFLQIGLQGELDRLIAHHVIPPLIAVMIQGGRGTNNWRMPYESYVLEVQELIDRMLPTVAARDARAIAGDSMGGYGAMNVALGNPYRFAVVESWLGFFNGLEGQLQADAPILSRLGLHAFVYGGESDVIANPAENEPFAAALRNSGADATGVVYPGGHSMETLEAHLGSMLVFAGRALGQAELTSTTSSRPRAQGHGTS